LYYDWFFSRVSNHETLKISNTPPGCRLSII